MFIRVTRYREDERERDIDGPIFLNSEHIVQIDRTTDYVTRIILSDGREFCCDEAMDIIEAQLDFGLVVG